jgi:CRP/FNR family cyclic AMP-dependent transcriptional regulator
VTRLSADDRLSKRATFLRKVPPLADLTDSDLDSLQEDLQIRDYDKGEIIFRQGDISREVYIVLSGSVRVFKVSPSGEETSIQIFSTGDMIGELAAIDGLPRSATAESIVRSELLVMAQERFVHHLRAMPDLALGMVKLLASKLRWTAAYAEAMAQFDAAGRLLQMLLLYKDRFGQELEAGKRYFLDLTLNQSDLASLVGTRRETVSRLLGSWHKRGLVEYDSGRITILDLPRLQAERDSRIGVVQEGSRW